MLPFTKIPPSSPRGKARTLLIVFHIFAIKLSQKSIFWLNKILAGACVTLTPPAHGIVPVEDERFPVIDPMGKRWGMVESGKAF